MKNFTRSLKLLMIALLASFLGLTQTHAQNHFDFQGGNPADPVWTLYFAGATLNGADLEAGDEIAIFDGDVMVGAFVLEQTPTPDNQFENDLAAFSTLNNGDGYTPGNPITLKCWDASEEIESEDFEATFLNPYGDAWTEPNFPEGDGVYSLLTVDWGSAPQGGTLQGTVTDSETTDPIEGATVTVEGTSFSATTDVNGDYTISDVDAGTYDVTASATGYESMTVTGVEIIDGETTTQDFALVPVTQYGMIDGMVTDTETTDPIEGATVTVEGTGLSATTGPDGTYLIEDVVVGTYDVTASATDYESMTQTGIEVVADQTTTVDFALTPMPGPAPTLISAEPGVESVTLTWEPISGGARTGYWDVQGNPADPVWTLYLGGVTLNGEDMVAGDEVGIFDGDLIVGAFTLDQVCTPDNQFDNDLVAWSTLNSGDGYVPGNPVTFKAYDDSEALEVNDFEATYNDPYGDAWTDPFFPEGDGQYSIMELSFSAGYVPTFNVYYEDGTLVEGDVEGNTYTDTGLTPGEEYCYYVTQIMEGGDESDPSNIECATPEAPPVGTVAGTVTDAETTDPIEGATVTIEGTGLSATTGPDGTYSIGDVDPGTYDVTADAADYESMTQTGIEVVGGETTTVDFALEPMPGPAPTLISAEPGVESVTLTWEPISGGARTGYWDVQGNPADPVWTLYLGGVTLDGEDMVAGDEVGIFDGDLIVGAFTLDQVCTPDNQFENDLVAWSTLNSGDGYVPGNPVTFKAYDDSEGLEVDDFEATYNDPYGDAWTDPFFPEGDGEYSIMELTYSSGGYVPTFNVYYDDGTLVEGNIEGNTYTDTGLTPGEEYCYYVTQIMEGGDESDPSNTECAIPEAPGTGTVAGTVTDAETTDPIEGATVTIEGTGLSATTDPDGNYSIGDVDPGTYDVTAEAPDYESMTAPGIEVIGGETTVVDFALTPIEQAPTLISAEPGVESITLTWEPIGGNSRTGYWEVSGNPADPVWTIYIGGATLDGEDMVEGDEVGVFDGDLIVGAFTLTQVCTPDNQFENDMAAWSTLDSGDGYTPGNAVTFKAYDDSEGMEVDDFEATYNDPYGDAWTTPEFPEGDGQYSILELAYTSAPYQPTFNVYYDDGTLVEGGVEGNTYTDTGLTPGEEYCYYVTQIMEGGDESDPSNTECAIPEAPGTGTVAGTVTDAETTDPIEGATVTIEGTGLSATTGPDGNYSIGDVDPGTYDVTADAADYQSMTQSGIEVVGGETTTVDFALEPTGQAPTLISAEPGVESVTLTWEPIGGNARTGYWDVSGNPADPVWTIFLSQVQLDDEDMIEGDEVGVFDGDLIVGAFTLDQVCTPDNQFENDLVAWSTLDDGDGYTPGNAVTFKAYDDSEGMEVGDFDVNYLDPYGDAWTNLEFPEGDGEYSLVELSFSAGGYVPTFNVYYDDGTLVEGGVDGNTYTDTGLEPGVEYCYYVTQIMENGEESDPSNTECATPIPPAGGTVAGTVTDAETTDPIEGATVTVQGTGLSGTTGPDGTYSIGDVPAGTYDVFAEAAGYNNGFEADVEVVGGETTTVDFALEPTGQAPTLISAEAGVESVTLTWEPIGGNARTGYWDVSGNPADPVWTIFLSQVQLDDEDMIEGDEVGVFDGDLIVGAFTLDQVCTPDNQFENDLIAWSTLDDGDGYTPGNAVTFKAYDDSEGMEVGDFDVNYLDPYGDAWTNPEFPEGDGEYSLVELSFSAGGYVPTFNVYYSDGTMVEGGIEGNTYTDTGLTPGEEYCYYVTQILESGDESDPSNIECATPEAPMYTVTTSANPPEGGTTTGDGEYEGGTEVTVTATANTDYEFINWTENGDEVSTDPEYTFVIESDRDLVANFEFVPTNAPTITDIEAGIEEITIYWEPIGGNARTGYWDVSGNPADPVWTIFLSQVQLDDEDMIEGDEVGVFDGDLIVGAFTLDQVCTPDNQFENDLVAWSTLDDGDGYTPGNAVTFKAYDDSEGMEVGDFDVNYLDPYGDAWTNPEFPEGDGEYSLVELSFSAGGYVPTFNVYYDDGTLVEGGVEGNMYTDTGLEPGVEYCYYVTQIMENGDESDPSNTECATPEPPAAGTIAGTVTDAETTDPIEGATVTVQGTGLTGTTGPDGTYSIGDVPAGTYDVFAEAAGYNPSTQLDVEVVGGETTTVDFELTPAGDAPTLISAEAGVESVTLTWEPIGGNSRIDHFQFEGGNPADPVWTIFLAMAQAEDEDMVEGDEIAIFDGDLMVGAYTLEQVCTPDNQFENDMIAWSTLTSGDGYTPGNPVSFKGWSESAQMEYDSYDANWLDPYGDAWTEPVFPEGDGEYSLIEISFSAGYEPTFNVYYADGTLVDGGVEGNTYTDTGLTPGEEYCYYVTQIMEGGDESDPSNIECATPTAPQGGTIAGTVTDAETTEPIEGATVTVQGTGLSGTTGPDGNYSIEGIDAGTYDVLAEAAGYVPSIQEDVEVVSGEVTTVDFALEVSTGAPTLISAEAGVESVTLTWEPMGGNSRVDYFQFEGGNPADPVWTIFLSMAQAEGEDMVEGDEIAIFDGDLMVGAYTLEQVCTPDNQFENDMIAWSTLTSGDGYTPGNPVSFKGWSESAQMEYENYDANWLDPYGDAWTNPEFPEGDGEYSLIEISFSGVYEPTFNVYYADGTLVEGGVEGTTYTDTGLTPGEEYCYYVTQIMEGGDESDPSNIECATPLPPEYGTVAGTVTDDDSGDPIEGATVTIQGTGQSATTGADGTYSIEDVVPGTYDVFAEAPDYNNGFEEDVEVVANQTTTVDFELTPAGDAPTLISAEPGAESVTLTWEPIGGSSRVDHFQFEGGNPADPVWTIFLAMAQAEDEDMVEGDEIAIFDGDLMVGAYTLEQVCTPDNQFENDMIAWSTLTSGDGYTPGNPVSFKGWSESAQMEYENYDANWLDPYGDAWTNPEFPEGDGEYSLIEISFSAGYQPTFNVYYADGTLVEGGVSGNTYTDTGLEAGVEYCYYVTQILESGDESDPSNIECATPYAPTGGTIAGTVVRGDNGDPIEGALVEAIGEESYSAITDEDGNYTIEEVATGTYDVTASYYGFEPYTETGVEVEDGQTTTVDFALTALAPTLVDAEPGMEQITLTWEAIGAGGGIHFNFEGGNPADPVWTLYIGGAMMNDEDMIEGDEIAIFDGDLMVGAFILDQVCTPDNQFENDMIAWSTLTSGDGYTPGNPVSFKAWDQSASAEATDYDVTFSDPYGDAWTLEEFPSADGEYSMVEFEFDADYSATFNLYYDDGTLVEGDIEGTTYTDTDLTPGEEYCYYVTQILDNGMESGASNTECATVPFNTATLTGTVTDDESGDPIEDATVTVVGPGLTANTDEDGNYTIEDIEPGTYDVTAEAAGYMDAIEEDVEFEGGETVTVDFELTPLGMPQNLEAQVDLWDVTLTWEPPAGFEPVWIHYDSGENGNSIGLTSGGSFEVAARWEPGDLEQYQGMSLTKMRIYVAGDAESFELKVWEGANAGNLVHSQSVDPTIDDWTEVELDQAIQIDVTQELWIGYAINNHPAGEYPGGTDSGPAVAGYGDMLNTGTSWISMANEYGLDYNWNIQGYLEQADGVSPTPIPDNFTATGGTTLEASGEGSGKSVSTTIRAIDGYNVYRDGDPIANLVESPYVDEEVAAGTYDYTVTAVIDGEESMPAGPVTVEVMPVFWGQVTELATGNPVSGADVTLDGYNTTTDGDGNYAMAVEMGDFEAMVEADGYNPYMEDVSIDGHYEWNPELTAPIMIVDPTMLAVDVVEGETKTATFNIENQGNGPLNWSTEITYIDGDGWLSLAPSSGTVDPGNNTDVTATLDATGLTAGESYNANIDVMSDPDVGTTTVEVMMDVIEGLDELDVDAFNLYPNPADAMVTIDLVDGIESVKVMNALGQVMDEMNVTSERSIKLDVSTWNNGAYMVQFTSEDGQVVTKKLMITH